MHTRGVRLLGGIMAGVIGGRAALADFDIPTFDSSAGLGLYGAASVTGGALRLTPSQFNISGAAYRIEKQSVASGFVTVFTFRLSEPVFGNADGFVFLVQNSVANIGGSGCRLGYEGISNSLAVEFDTNYNDSCEAGVVGDPNGNHVSVHTRGLFGNTVRESASIGWTTAVPHLADGQVHTAMVEYDLGVLRVFVDDLDAPVLEIAVDLGTLLSLDNGLARVGFSAATGGYSQAHDILSWSYTSNPNPGGKHRPATPIIQEPQFDGSERSPSDVHMETAPMTDADGDGHVCTDWEIWAISPWERVWSTLCIGGFEKLHTHLGDGVFEGSHAGRRDLLYSTDYVLRVRHRDDGEDPARQWSFAASRTFRTGAPGAVFPMLLDDIADPPLPSWADGEGGGVVLPGGATPARLVVSSAAGEVLLEIAGTDGSANSVINPGPLADHGPALVRVEGGETGVTLPATRLGFLHDCEPVEIFLPPIALAPGGGARYWVAEDGSTYVAEAGETEPQFGELAEGSAVPWLVKREGYVVERFATGFHLPVNIAFVPSPGPNADDPLFYVSELYGAVRMVTRDGSVGDYATGLLNFNPTGNFPGTGEQGLSGLLVDPATGDVFLALLYEAWPAGPHFPKIVRFTSLDGGRTAATQTTVLAMPGEHMGQSHFISNLSFGPDGKLYVHMGDGLDPATAQDMSVLRGKVLRINLDGTAPSDNPFYNAADGIGAADYVYALGLRNPFGGGWRSSDGAHFSVENGPSIDRLARIDRVGSPGTELEFAL